MRIFGVRKFNLHFCEQVSTLVLAGATIYLRNKGLSLESLSGAPLNVQAALGVASASALFLGASLLEYLSTFRTQEAFHTFNSF